MPTSAAKEIAFIDRGIADIDSFLAGLRPDIEPIVLSSSQSAPAQIAKALCGRSALAAIHIVAHGQAGEVSFSSGALSLESVNDHADELAAIGQSLGDNGNLFLWTCHTAQSKHGQSFVEALSRASGYAKSRIVFNRPIGMNQAIQHPLAKNWMELEAAWLMVLRAAWQYDRNMPCGPAANAAKFLAAEAGFRACEQAVMTHGGFGYAKEYHVERYLRESLIPRIAPISPQLVLSFIAEKVLGLPKSY